MRLCLRVVCSSPSLAGWSLAGWSHYMPVIGCRRRSRGSCPAAARQQGRRQLCGPGSLPHLFIRLSLSLLPTLPSFALLLPLPLPLSCAFMRLPWYLPSHAPSPSLSCAFSGTHRQGGAPSLFMASLNGHLDVVRLLLDNTANQVLAFGSVSLCRCVNTQDLASKSPSRHQP
jgi:hypothetical protein